ncbi:2879_t:CDS:2, partial [Dentiscutata erythropus]
VFHDQCTTIPRAPEETFPIGVKDRPTKLLSIGNQYRIHASSLSFWPVDIKVREKFINLFRDRHSSASALHVFEDDLYLNTINEQELLKIFADRAYNPDNEFLVPSTKENNDTNYIVNSELGICSCPVGMSGAPCKHQGAVAVKFHVSIFNFIPLLTPDDRAIYAYIALGYITQDKLFYASLYARPILQNQEILCTKDKVEIFNDLLRTEW